MVIYPVALGLLEGSGISIMMVVLHARSNSSQVDATKLAYLNGYARKQRPACSRYCSSDRM